MLIKGKQIDISGGFIYVQCLSFITYSPVQLNNNCNENLQFTFTHVLNCLSFKTIQVSNSNVMSTV